MWKMKYSTWHKGGTKKNLSPWQESTRWPPEYWVGALSTELRELMENEVIFTEFTCDRCPAYCYDQHCHIHHSWVVISEWRWWILSLVIKCERWNIQHDTTWIFHLSQLTSFWQVPSMGLIESTKTNTVVLLIVGSVIVHLKNLFPWKLMTHCTQRLKNISLKHICEATCK